MLPTIDQVPHCCVLLTLSQNPAEDAYFYPNSAMLQDPHPTQQKQVYLISCSLKEEHKDLHHGSPKHHGPPLALKRQIRHHQASSLRLCVRERVTKGVHHNIRLKHLALLL
jgi:hypothetical protein